MNASGILSSPSSLKIQIWNETQNKEGIADELKLIKLEGGMVPIFQTENIQGKYNTPIMEIPDSLPVLIQIKYKNVSYNKMLPPVAEMRSGLIKVSVFDDTQDQSVLKVKSFIEVLKEVNRLLVYKIYIIENNSSPKKSYINDQNPFRAYLPSSATEVRASLTQEGSRMAIPLNLQDGKLDRGIQPGTSELQISYSIPLDSEKLVFHDEISPIEGGERILFARPRDMELIQGNEGNFSEIIADDIPAGNRAFRMKFSDQGKFEVVFKGGTPLLPDPSKIQRTLRNGSILDTWQNSLLAVLASLLFFVSIASFLIYKPRDSKS
jgi:hypothetical protein